MKFSSQLKLMIYKNFLIKKSKKIELLFTFLIPIIIMSILLLIYSKSDTITSSPIAYYCGNIYPWSYSDTIPPYQCTIEPSTCTESDYYQDGSSIDSQTTVYTQYGNVQSGLLASSFLSSLLSSLILS